LALPYRSIVLERDRPTESALPYRSITTP